MTDGSTVTPTYVLYTRLTHASLCMRVCPPPQKKGQLDQFSRFCAAHQGVQRTDEYKQIMLYTDFCGLDRHLPNTSGPVQVEQSDWCVLPACVLPQ